MNKKGNFVLSQMILLSGEGDSNIDDGTTSGDVFAPPNPNLDDEGGTIGPDGGVFGVQGGNIIIADDSADLLPPDSDEAFY